MKNREDKIYDLIEDYLSKRLSDQERMSFEDSLKSDPRLREKVKLHEMAGEMIIERRLLEVKALAREEGIRIDKRKKFQQWSVAIVVLVSAIVAFMYFTSEEKAVVQKIVKSPLANKGITIPLKDSMHASEPIENAPVIIPDAKVKKSGYPKVSENLPEKSKPDEVKENLAQNLVIKNEHEKTPPLQKMDSTSIKTQEKKTDPCTGISLEADISIESPCENEYNGAINISNIRGGKRPYVFHIYDSSESELLKNGIGKGVYSVTLKDATSCERKYSGIQVIEKICPIDYVFNASIGEKWKIPVRDHDGNLRVFNQSGEVVLERNIPAGQQSEWDGQSDSNGEIYTGYLIFVINYSNGINAKGSITILR